MGQNTIFDLELPPVGVLSLSDGDALGLKTDRTLWLKLGGPFVLSLSVSLVLLHVLAGSPLKPCTKMMLPCFSAVTVRIHRCPVLDWLRTVVGTLATSKLCEPDPMYVCHFVRLGSALPASF